MRLANSKISWIDIQFDSSKFTTAIRGSSSGCKGAEDTPVCSKEPRGQRQKKAYISKYKNGQINEEGKSMVFTSSKSRNFIKAFSYGLLPLDMLLISVSKGFLRFLGLANADLVDFSAVVLATVAASQAFLEASSSASRDDMRALAATKSSTAQGEERKLDKRAIEAQNQANKRHGMEKSLP
jgi:hypothetical protein